MTAFVTKVLCGACGGDGQVGMHHDGQPRVCELCDGKGELEVGGSPEDRALEGQPAEVEECPCLSGEPEKCERHYREWIP